MNSQNRRSSSFIHEPDMLNSWRVWLPTRGNVLFTLLVLGGLFWAVNAGALPLQLSTPPAAAPSASSTTINYQGYLTNATGNPVNDTLDVVFRLYNLSSGGSSLWNETHNGVVVTDGLFSVLLGSMNPIPIQILADNSDLWLGINVGSDQEMTPREKIASAPYAMVANVPDGSITTVKLADNAITTAKIVSGAVGSSEIGGSAVGSSEISNGAVTADKLANGSVTQEKAPSLLLGPGNNYRILAGQAMTNSNGGADYFFNPPFSEPPAVVAVAQGYNVQLFSPPTASHASFTINSATSGVTIHWVAVGH